MLLGLHLVGHGNGTEVFNQRRDMMTSVFWEGDLGTDGGGVLGGRTAPLKGHCNCLSNRTGGHREPRVGGGRRHVYKQLPETLTIQTPEVIPR